ncbi:MAG: hypothetical protein A2X86_06725 [Bdellovibrionales bacterium GWA2_49_15]|nr:MAG: hypothetical protein A2X86_06725 [Bdellovibrionales bacterium GWA2_49_15]HAZ12032.1 hypothetical protein [Bdellovibrionales bacterium]
MAYGSRETTGELPRQVPVRKLLFGLLTYFCLIHSVAWAQQEQISSVGDESLRDMYIVLGTTAVGATLGLSTLSFVEEPGHHLKNVIVGGALGIIVGVGVVAYMQANKSRDLYLEGGGEEGAPEGALIPKLEELSPMADASEYYKKKSGGNKNPLITFSFSF